MVEVLRLRAYFDDKASGSVTAEKQQKAEDIIANAVSNHNSAPAVITKGMSKTEKKLVRICNENIEIAKVVWDEINYFNTDLGKMEYEVSKRIVDAGENNFLTAIDSVKALLPL